MYKREHMSVFNKTGRVFLLAAGLFFVASLLSAGEMVSYFRKIRIGQDERIRGFYPLDEAEALDVNCYKFSTLEDGRISRIEYLRRGTSLKDPLLGVPVMQFSYNGNYIRRNHLDSSGKPVPDEQGVYSVRLRQNSAGDVTAAFHYDRYGNLKADSKGIASVMWDVDKMGRKVSELYFDPEGNRVGDDGVFELRYLYDERGNLAMTLQLDERGLPVNSGGRPASCPPGVGRAGKPGQGKLV